MNVPSTSPPKGASHASLVYAGKNKVPYFLNTSRIFKTAIYLKLLVKYEPCIILALCTGRWACL
jgi:hypothetical protein